MSKRAGTSTSAVLRESAYAANDPPDMTRTRWSTTLTRVSASIVPIAIVSVSAYLILELMYVRRMPLIADEFDGAYDVYQLRNKLPYVDFKPYKTVLGYYLQLPPLLLADSVWHGLITSKIMLAVINAGCMLCTSLIVARKYSTRAVAIALPCWVVMTDWLERSAELRVDTLTAWGGMFSLLALLAGRPALAGFLCGLAFLISQKGLYFLVASVAGLVAVALISPHARPRDRAHALARFSATYVATVGVYLAFWAAVGSLHATTTATFLSHRSIVFADIYPNIRRYWWQTITRNPLYYALVCASLAWLGARAFSRSPKSGPETAQQEDAHKRDVLLFGYGALFATCIIWHKQPWPYFFVLLVPIAFVMQVWLFEQLWSAYDRRANGDAPHAAPSKARRALAAGLLVVIAIGCIALPALRIKPMLRQRNAYQRNMLALADALVGRDEHYIAAADMLYNRAQASSKLRRVSLARRRELRVDPAKSSDEILEELAAHPPKVLIHNERFDAFPKGVIKYLRSNYTQFWGVIDLYAPRLPRGDSTLQVLFAGQYRLTDTEHEPVRIGGELVAEDQTITLARGPLDIESVDGGRLRLQAPDLSVKLDPRQRRRRAFYGNAYGR